MSSARNFISRRRDGEGELKKKIKENPLLEDAFKWDSISVAFSYPASVEDKA